MHGKYSVSPQTEAGGVIKGTIETGKINEQKEQIDILRDDSQI